MSLIKGKRTLISATNETIKSFVLFSSLYLEIDEKLTLLKKTTSEVYKDLLNYFFYSYQRIRSIIQKLAILGLKSEPF